MATPEPPDTASWTPPESAASHLTRATLLCLYAQLAALSSLWLGLFSFGLAQWRGVAAAAGVLLSVPLASLSIVAALCLLLLCARPPQRAWWAWSLVMVVGAVATALYLGILPGGTGRPGMAGLAVALLITGSIAWLALNHDLAPSVLTLRRLGWVTALAGTMLASVGATTLAESYRLEAVHQARQLSHQLVYHTYGNLNHAVTWLRRLADRWAVLSTPPTAALMRQELTSYLRDLPAFRELAVIDDTDTVLALGLPDRSTATAAGSALQADVRERPELAMARRTAQLARSPALPAGPDRIETLVFMPVVRNNAPDTVLLAVLGLDALLDEAALRMPAGFVFQVRFDDTVAYRSESTWPAFAEHAGSIPIPLDHTTRWHLDYRFSPVAGAPLARLFPELILLAGLVFTFLLIATQQLARLARSRARQLQHSALHDALTGLPNRRLLEQTLADACDQQRAQGGSVAIIFIDLDGVKVVNDSLGHAVGDRLLAEVARRIAALVGNYGFVARVGGDEFVVLLADKPDTFTENLAGRLIAELARPYHVGAAEIRLTATAGITTSTGDVKDPMQVVREADLAMVRAKQEGRNTWRRYTVDLSARVAERLAVRNKLQQALEQNTFELHYQPVVDGQNGRIIGLEALLRWRDNHAEFPPARFLPLAEETGQIVPISHWVLEQACAHATELRRSGLPDMPVIVNISPLYFQREDFVDRVQLALAHANLPGSSLAIEITEEVLLADAESATRTLTQLRALGVNTSIDDFGTGYSSLNYLRNLPIDKIKIDRSFIEDVVSDPNDAAIVQSIIAMAHHLELKVVAEGIETEAQYTFLRRHHCDQYQGFLFCHPQPFATMLQHLHESGSRLLLPGAERPADDTRTLLLLDDEPNILRALMRLLRREGYRVLIANTPDEAFDLLARHEVQVIMSDQRMPGLSGIDFFSQVKDLYPHTVRIILSGYTDLRSVTEAINRGAIYKFLTKPWDDTTLRAEIAQAFLHHDEHRAA